MTAKVLYVFFVIQIFSFDGCFSQDSEKKIIRPICSIYCFNKPAYCPYGYEFDSMGCSTCTCRNPCSNYTCPFGEVCLAEELTCTNPPCGLRPRCVCNIRCLYGYETDCGGCKTCRCRDPCRGVICPWDQYCSVQKDEPVCIFREYCLDGTLPQLDSDSNLIKCIPPLEISLAAA
ncbi:hypothetical protein RI129_004651 [Pyrocoelia pectoralis]|uniref:Follistatin-like domain-containing protein n=1 Tax=Pyrocoelia pectoralis TaxID=417401 RepID=A0AAN7ZJI6_9COLE